MSAVPRTDAGAGGPYGRLGAAARRHRGVGAGDVRQLPRASRLSGLPQAGGC
ncbi:MAG: hypothetical protein KAI86_12475 [Desulfobacterales bacterium]|nr:hypothetical protein [Desulfobacterales bacterium]